MLGNLPKRLQARGDALASGALHRNKEPELVAASDIVRVR